ncbi:MAG TPA: histidine phosphatase family protein [Candidatus Saccharimonadales bacterium]|nr:histidine phosphatase family protein [Candidatus Saccharimonadales bacterium]
MQRIYLLRHGQSQNNAHKIVSGLTETPLTELGKQQAETAGVMARALDIDLIVCSPLGRAKETAKLVAKQIGYPESEIKVMKGLAERELGNLEGMSYAKNERLNGNFPAVEHIYGVEPLPQFYSRVQHALRRILQDKTHHTVLIVSHQGVGRMLRTIAEGKPPHAMYDQTHLANATLYPLL